DVVVHPAQCRDDVHHADVTRRGELLVASFFEGREAEHVETVIDRDDHDITALGQIESFGYWRRSRSGRESAAVTPEHHRALAVVMHRRRPDVQDEAV